MSFNTTTQVLKYLLNYCFNLKLFSTRTHNCRSFGPARGVSGESCVAVRTCFGGDENDLT